PDPAHDRPAVVRRARLALRHRDRRDRLRGLPDRVRHLLLGLAQQLVVRLEPAVRELLERQLHRAQPDELLAVDRQHARDRLGHRDRDRAHGCGRRVRLLALPLLGAPGRAHEPARDPDVPPAARLRRGVPPAALARRGRARARAQLAARAHRGLPRRGARGEHLPHVRLLQHDPQGDRRGREDRRREPRSGLLDDHPAPRGTDPRGRRAAELHQLVLGLPARQAHPAVRAELDPRGRHVPVGLRPDQPELGPVCRRRGDQRDPGRAAVPVPAEAHRRRSHRGLGQVTGLGPHHDGSELYVPAGTPGLGDVVPVRLRVPAGYGETSVHVRYVHDGEPFLAEARHDRTGEGERWYVAEVPVHNPVTSYRFLVDHPGGYHWVDGRGTHHRDVADAADFRLTVHEPGPDWLRDGAVYQVFPDRFARSRTSGDLDLPDWAVPAPSWDAEPPLAGREAAATVYGGDLRGIAERLDHLEQLGADVLYLTPVFEARSVHRYDAVSFDRVDPLLGGDAALVELCAAVHARGMRIMGDLTTNHTGVGHEWFTRALADRSAPEADFFYWTDAGHVGWKGHASLPKLDWASTELAHRMVTGADSVTTRWLREPFALDGWRVDVANMTGRLGAQDDASHVARLMRTAMAAVRPDLALVAEHAHD